MTDIEILRHDRPIGRFRAVVFDFDGTLSLIREGWPQVMIPMMLDILRATGTTEDDATLVTFIEDFVMENTGKQTIYQMIRLADEVRKRGGEPLDPLAYKHEFNGRLMRRIQGRLDALTAGLATATDWTVPGSHSVLQSLAENGLSLYLASGTDVDFVKHEARLLGLAPYFGDHIYGALDDHKSFSKRMIVERILRDHNLSGAELLGFGDGYVEIEEVKRVGGVAVAVASDEVKREGIDPWKRERLARAGADIVIGDYRCLDRLLPLLF